MMRQGKRTERERARERRIERQTETEIDRAGERERKNERVCRFGKRPIVQRESPWSCHGDQALLSGAAAPSLLCELHVDSIPPDSAAWGLT